MVFHDGETVPIGSPALRVRVFGIPDNATSTKKQGRYYVVCRPLDSSWQFQKLQSMKKLYREYFLHVDFDNLRN